jgi:hypothetical protein
MARRIIATTTTTTTTISSPPPPRSLLFHQGIPTISWSQVQVQKDDEHQQEEDDWIVLPSVTILEAVPLAGLTCSVINRNPRAHKRNNGNRNGNNRANDESSSHLLSTLQHEHIVRIHAMGTNFLVVDPWEQTLRQRLERRRRKCSSSSSSRRNIFQRSWGRKSSNSHHPTNEYDDADLWTRIALPIIRALHYLHQRSISYNSLSLDSVVFSSTNQLYLMDFSYASMTHHEDTSSYDILCLGRLLQELLQLQNSQNENNPPSVLFINELIGACCHENPSCRPSIRRVRKRMLEFTAAPTLTLPFTNEPTTTTSSIYHHHHHHHEKTTTTPRNNQQRLKSKWMRRVEDDSILQLDDTSFGTVPTEAESVTWS